MTETIEKKICTWKTNAEFQYGSLSEEKKEKFRASQFYVGYEKCIKCSGKDELCSKYQDLKKMGFI